MRTCGGTSSQPRARRLRGPRTSSWARSMGASTPTRSSTSSCLVRAACSSRRTRATRAGSVLRRQTGPTAPSSPPPCAGWPPAPRAWAPCASPRGAGSQPAGQTLSTRRCWSCTMGARAPSTARRPSCRACRCRTSWMRRACLTSTSSRWVRGGPVAFFPSSLPCFKPPCTDALLAPAHAIDHCAGGASPTAQSPPSLLVTGRPARVDTMLRHVLAVAPNPFDFHFPKSPPLSRCRRRGCRAAGAGDDRSHSHKC